MSSLADLIPFAKALGIDIAEATAARVTARMQVRPDLCTSGGALHGGAIMSLADTVGAIGAYLALPEGASGTTTLESKTNFVSAAMAGAFVTAEATPVHAGKRTSVWQTRVCGEDGKLVALITQTQLVLAQR